MDWWVTQEPGTLRFVVSAVTPRSPGGALFLMDLIVAPLLNSSHNPISTIITSCIIACWITAFYFSWFWHVLISEIPEPHWWRCSNSTNNTNTFNSRPSFPSPHLLSHRLPSPFPLLAACKRKEQDTAKERNSTPKKSRLVFTDLQRRTLLDETLPDTWCRQNDPTERETERDTDRETEIQLKTEWRSDSEKDGYATGGLVGKKPECSSIKCSWSDRGWQGRMCVLWNSWVNGRMGEKVRSWEL